MHTCCLNIDHSEVIIIKNLSVQYKCTVHSCKHAPISVIISKIAFCTVIEVRMCVCMNVHIQTINTFILVVLNHPLQSKFEDFQKPVLSGDKHFFYSPCWQLARAVWALATCSRCIRKNVFCVF